MNNSLEGYAAALELICKKRKVGKKAIQKFMYLMERKGVEFDLDYKIHFFGPYSVKLTHILHALESRGVIDIDTSGELIRLVSQIALSTGKGGLSCNGKKIVEEVLSNFGDNLLWNWKESPL
jgi:uncharacterized protein YwgA